MTYGKWILLLAVVAGLLWAWWTLPVGSWMRDLGRDIESMGWTGTLIFGLIYVLATVCLLPCAPLTFAGGVIYGFWALPLVLVSSWTGASLAFVVARFLAKDRVDRLVEKRPQTRALKEVVEREGLKFMILLRISPIVPFNLNNYFLGTAPVTFGDYLAATAIGSIPGTMVYIYLGTLGRDPGEPGPLKWALLALGVASTYALTRFVLKRTQRILSLQNSIH